MRVSLSFLPLQKQTEIAGIVDIIKEVVNPEMIVLFGSYAKDNYTEHRYTEKNGDKYEYISDYDFLVVTKNNPEKASSQENLIMNKAGNINPPINLEIHDIDYVNKGLEMGEYFWVDIAHEGINLFDKGTVVLTKPGILTREEQKEKALLYFDTWFPQANEFIAGSKFYAGRGNYKLGAFELHQATESLYYAVLLVFTDYKPKTHNLWKLRKKTKAFSRELYSVFRTETDKNEELLFNQLKKGYVDARYRTDYEISAQQLIILTERVSLMVPIVESVCKQKIAALSIKPE